MTSPTERPAPKDGADSIPEPRQVPVRGTESPLEIPSGARTFSVLWRTLKLRCPNCGKGRVLTWSGSVVPRCTSCNFRFERSDDRYFSGAMFFGLLTGEIIFAVALVIVILAMRPNVPWDTMRWAIPVGMGVVMLALIPLSKIGWLAVDVLIRPVQPEELR